MPIYLFRKARSVATGSKPPDENETGNESTVADGESHNAQCGSPQPVTRTLPQHSEGSCDPSQNTTRNLGLFPTASHEPKPQGARFPDWLMNIRLIFRMAMQDNASSGADVAMTVDVPSEQVHNLKRKHDQGELSLELLVTTTNEICG
jgi:hypothetical protein